MDKSMLREIDYLQRLIEHHKSKIPDRLHHNGKTLPSQNLHVSYPEKPMTLIRKTQPPAQRIARTENTMPAKCQLKSTNVHVNPNFKPQNPVIHINPKVRIKPLVHVNPKMMKNVTTPSKVSDIKFTNIAVAPKQPTVQTDIKRSVYVNPKLMQKLSSATDINPVDRKQTIVQEAAPVCSRLKLVKSTNSPKVVTKKPNSSSVLILSQRKLIRIRRGSKGSASSLPVGLHKIKKPLNSPFKKVKVTPQRAIKPKINKYRIDRTVQETTKIKKSVIPGQKKSVNKTLELITIGGIVYKSSKNQLVRRSLGLKRKRTANVKTDKFIVATNGNKLCRLKSTKEIQASRTKNTSIGTKVLSGILQKTNYKNNVSNKVKQRSIQILRNKMRKNNQPCLIFQRFGFCANHEKRTCPKLHDKKQISLCKKFLQGNCLLNKCPLSHDVGPEKMPTCKYFLEGCCTRDACPYLHVKVSSSTPICIEFLQGYCAKGHECERRHENLCPEYVKTGKCSKGKYCPYPHKSHSSAIKQTDKYLKRKYNVPGRDKVTKTTAKESCNHESRLRYYEQADTIGEDLEAKRESIMKKIKIMKHVEAAAHFDQASALTDNVSEKDKAISSEVNQNDSELEIINDTRIPKRPPIGTLPAYIPIN